MKEVKKFVYEDEVLHKLQKLVFDALKNLFTEVAVSQQDVQIDFPKDPAHGDYASSIALKLAGQLKSNPLEIAEKLSAKINEIGPKDFIDSADAVAPGFINFRLNPNYLKLQLLQILDQKDSYGQSSIGEGKRIMIEFGQPNTHKAFHLGHLRSAISGLSMVRLHEALGYEVIKANYFGDIGMHVAKATWGFLKQGEPDGFTNLSVHEQMAYIDQCYVYGSKAFKDDPVAETEIREINSKIYALYGQKDSNNIEDEAFATYVRLRNISLQHQTEVWQKMGIVFDREYPEGEVFQSAKKLVDQHKGDVFEQDDGAWIYRGEKDGLQTWVFETKDGNPTYSAKDLGLGKLKFEEYNPDLAIITTSVEQIAYFKAVIKCLEKIVPETTGKYMHVPFGWMLLNNKKFSSRQGASIKGVEVLEQAYKLAQSKISETKEYNPEKQNEIVDAVGMAGLKFLVLSHEFHKNINYDPETFIQLDGFSGPYILYSYARSRAILRKAGAESESYSDSDLVAGLNNEYEQALIKQLMKYPSDLKAAGVQIAPHIIANYLYELAQAFNAFYRECPVVDAAESDRKARLALVEAAGQVLKNGLWLLGIETVEEM